MRHWELNKAYLWDVLFLYKIRCKLKDYYCHIRLIVISPFLHA